MVEHDHWPYKLHLVAVTASGCIDIRRRRAFRNVRGAEKASGLCP
jgi:hypothetical protein